MRRRDEIELFIARFALEHNGNCPSLGDIAQVFGISRQAVYFHVQKLVAEGRMDITDGHFSIRGAVYHLPSRLKELLAMTPEIPIPGNATPRRGDCPIEDLKEMYMQQRGLCWWCGGELRGVYEVDHRVPLALGGHNQLDNLCLACPSCNRHKSDKMPWEFNGRLL